MNFLGVGGLEFLLIFGVAMFFLGPKRLAEGVRTGRKYYRELRKYRNELSSMVKEAIDADGLKKDLEQTKRDVWDESDTRSLQGLEKDLAIETGDGSLDIPELDFTRSVAKETAVKSASGNKTGEPDAGSTADIGADSPGAESPANESRS